MKIRTYTELSRLPTFDERFDYLKLDGRVGDSTFGFDRYLNQTFYRSKEWMRVRDDVILRDYACDLGIPDHWIGGGIFIHHMNPISVKDFENASEFLLNPEYLITTCLLTHNAIHYGDRNLLPKDYVERKPNDTCPWKQEKSKWEEE